jgi:hypothetical protein
MRRVGRSWRRKSSRSRDEKATERAHVSFFLRKMAEACGNRTHPSRLSRDADGFEVRESHQAPCASGGGLSQQPNGTLTSIRACWPRACPRVVRFPSPIPPTVHANRCWSAPVAGLRQERYPHAISHSNLELPPLWSIQQHGDRARRHGQVRVLPTRDPDSAEPPPRRRDCRPTLPPTPADVVALPGTPATLPRLS